MSLGTVENMPPRAPSSESHRLEVGCAFIPEQEFWGRQLELLGWGELTTSPLLCWLEMAPQADGLLLGGVCPPKFQKLANTRGNEH